MSARVTVSAESRTGTARAAVTGSDVRWQHTKNDTGSGQTVLSPDDAAAVSYGDVIRFHVDGTPRFSSLVEQQVAQLVATGEESDQLVTLSGRGTAAAFEEAVVGPEGGAAAGNTTQTRVFNFASPLLSETGWAHNALVAGARAKPEGWPDPLTEWVWSQDPLTIPVPAGDVYFRKHFTVSADTIAEVWCAADDGYEVWLDGMKLFEDTLDTAWTGVAKQQKVFIRTGSDHLLAVHARNNNALLAGLFVCVITKDANDSITGVAARGESGASDWYMLAYPTNPPGFTPGQVMLILLGEAVARGAKFTSGQYANAYDAGHAGLVDWADVTWPVVSDISVQVGQDLLSVLHQLAETYLDFDMDYSVAGIGNLRLFVNQGTSTGVTFAAGSNLGEYQADGRA